MFAKNSENIMFSEFFCELFSIVVVLWRMFATLKIGNFERFAQFL